MDAARIIVCPPLRCFARSEGAAATICGRHAVGIRPAGTWGNVGFVCAEHAGPTDLPVPAEITFRRVRLLAQADFAGVSWLAQAAEAEALERLERAVAEAGGLLTNVSVSSCMVRHVVEAAALSVRWARG